jgi:ABC-type sugar transport system permease subunit
MSIAAEQGMAAVSRLPIGARLQQWRRRNRQLVEAYVILSPMLVYYSVFFIFPVATNLFISFTRWNGITGAPKWVGLKNYGTYFTQAYPLIILNTFTFAVVILIIQTILAFLIAVLLNEKVFGRGAFRTLFYIPTLTSAAITAQVTFAFISPFDGALNNVLKSMGLPIVIWTANTFWMRAFIILYTIWRGLGGGIVYFLAGLQGIHREVYEAAMVDGATARQLLLYITLPLLRPMLIFVLITGMIGGFQIFEAVLLMSHGGPANTTNVMLLQIYNDAFVNTNMGVASAGSMIMAVLLLWFSLTNIRIMSRGQVEG